MNVSQSEYSEVSVNDRIVLDKYIAKIWTNDAVVQSSQLYRSQIDSIKEMLNQGGLKPEQITVLGDVTKHVEIRYFIEVNSPIGEGPVLMIVDDVVGQLPNVTLDVIKSAIDSACGTNPGRRDSFDTSSLPLPSYQSPVGMKDSIIELGATVLNYFCASSSGCYTVQDQNPEFDVYCANSLRFYPRKFYFMPTAFIRATYNREMKAQIRYTEVTGVEMDHSGKSLKITYDQAIFPNHPCDFVHADSITLDKIKDILTSKMQ